MPQPAARLAPDLVDLANGQRAVTRVCSIEGIASWENLFLAAAKAVRGKSRRPEVEDWWRRRESELAALRGELLSGAWRPAPYRLFTIHEPKRREIAAAPFHFGRQRVGRASPRRTRRNWMATSSWSRKPCN